jgi:ABC-type lipoprotein release transport system permease subunit
MPALKAMLEMSDTSLFVMGLILFGVISIGVVNSLLMALYERMYEFGVLKAIGTRPSRIARLIFLESACLAAIALAIGLLLGGGLTYWFSKNGIPFPATEYAGAVIRDRIPVIPTFAPFLVRGTTVFLVTLAAGIYPAWIAARLQPSQAMRKSL